jgi:glycosyltransferase involved in cell wall biosynthesis
MRVALVHDWLTGMRGGEKVLEEFCRIYPQADIYTLLHVNGSVSPTIESHSIRSSFVQRLPRVEKTYRYYLPLFPLAIETIKLRGYDLILSSSHCVAKGVRVPSGACHISYVHTPMRYVWDQYSAYFDNDRCSPPVRYGMRALRPWLQRNDVATSRRVHYFIANSHHVAERIRRCYGREATVIHPPLEFDSFARSPRDDGYYLMVTAFAPYKRVDLAVETFNMLGLPLKIIGSGQEEVRLRRIAGPSVEFLGWRSDDEVREAYAGCSALIFPGEEDFGIVPLEAMASGKPVIAYGKGGVLETVIPLDQSRAGTSGVQSSSRKPTGVFFHRQEPAALSQAVSFFEGHRECFDPEHIRAHARLFDQRLFREKIKDFVESKYAEFHASAGTDLPR